MWNEFYAVMIIVMGIIVMLFSLVVLPIMLRRTFRAVFRKPLGLHRWEYRNPFDRTCSVCKRHEVNHCSPGGNIWSKPGWWEVFNDGDANAQPCGREQSE